MELCESAVEVIKNRIEERVPMASLSKLLDNGSYRVAGNSLNAGELHDIDVYPSYKGQFDNIVKALIANEEKMSISIICDTKNAITAMVCGVVVQFCKYFHATLADLVDSFDFTHIQIGAEIKGQEVTSVYCTDAYVETLVGKGTSYSGSDYPLSSLFRLIKYAKRGNFNGKTWKHDIFVIFKDIVERGFIDYDDFRDQLDAVDLSYLEESGEARELFNVIKKRWIGVED